MFAWKRDGGERERRVHFVFRCCFCLKAPEPDKLTTLRQGGCCYYRKVCFFVSLAQEAACVLPACARGERCCCNIISHVLLQGLHGDGANGKQQLTESDTQR